MTNLAGVKPRVCVFAGSDFALNIIDFLHKNKQLAGVVLAVSEQDLDGRKHIAECIGILQHAGIPYRFCEAKEVACLPEQLTLWQANVGIIATFPHRIPGQVLKSLPLGVYNLHGSALPKYPGPAPLYWQIRNGENATALVLHRVTTEMDRGNIIFSQDVSIHPLDTSRALLNRLAHGAVSLVNDLLIALQQSMGPLPGRLQNDLDCLPVVQGMAYARRPQWQDCVIQLDRMTAEEISALCRAGNGTAHCAQLAINQVWVQVLQSTPVDFPTFGTLPGTILFLGDPEGWIVTVHNGALRLDVLSCSDGIYSGLAFAERFGLDAGMLLIPTTQFKQRA